MDKAKTITVQATINSPVEKVWRHYTTPKDIMKWNHASENWHTISAENDVKVGGKFSSRMEAKDKSFGFDFVGKYTEVEKEKVLAYQMGDGRNAKITFTKEGQKTKPVVIFEAENENSIEMQKKTAGKQF